MPNASTIRVLFISFLAVLAFSVKPPLFAEERSGQESAEPQGQEKTAKTQVLELGAKVTTQPIK